VPNLGTLVIWACVHGILTFKKNISMFLFFVNIFHNSKEKLKHRLHEAALLKRNNFEDLSHYKIRYLLIATNLH